MNYTLIGIAIYLVGQIAIGVWASRRIKDETDYVLAGRSFGYVLATFSIFATWFGAETCIGSAAEIHEHGLSAAAHDPFGYAICILLMGAVLARPLWNRQLTTLSDLFRTRYSAGVERLATLMMVPTSLLWAAAQIRAFGQILAASSSLTPGAAIAIAAGVVIIYTATGGLLADALTDIVQGVVLIAGLLFSMFVVIGDLGGVSAAFEQIDSERLSLFTVQGAWHQTLLLNAEAWLVPICGSIVAQELVARVLASRSPTVARRACFGATFLYLLIGLIPLTIGLLGPVLMPDHVEPEQLLARVIQAHVSPALYIVFIGALLSAILSTVDSALLAASTLTTENLIASAHTLTPRQKLMINRTGVITFGLVAALLAGWGSSVFDLVVDASSFGSAGVFSIVMFGLFWRRGGPWAATGSLLAGMGLWVAMHYGFETGFPYVIALAGAVGTYLVIALFEPPEAGTDPAYFETRTGSYASDAGAGTASS